MPRGSVNKQTCLTFIDMFPLTLHDHHLTQLQKKPSREDRVLDLICSNKRSLVQCVTSTPGISSERLLGKLAHYGVRGPILDWVLSFLSDRQMRVAVDGVCSPWTRVTSGVPQGTVLGPLLFLIYINDLPDCATEGTVVRLFADDCLVYRIIHSHDDQVILDKDLASPQKGSERWGMSFNPHKCNILQVSRGDPSSHFYQLCG